MLCEYGCNTIANYTLGNGKKCCSEHYSSCPALREKNSKGVAKAHSDGKIPGFNSEHREKSRVTNKKKAIDRFLRDGTSISNHAVKKRLEWLGVEQCCAQCGVIEWRGQVLPLELDHINGKSTDNRLENLRLLCPNCHSLTETWRGKNINNGKIKVSDEELLTAYNNSANIRQTLIEVGLAPKGANYTRVKRLISGSGEIGETHKT